MDLKIPCSKGYLFFWEGLAQLKYIFLVGLLPLAVMHCMKWGEKLFVCPFLGLSLFGVERQLHIFTLSTVQTSSSGNYFCVIL